MFWGWGVRTSLRSQGWYMVTARQVGPWWGHKPSKAVLRKVGGQTPCGVHRLGFLIHFHDIA